jgi:integral membrane protein
MTESGPTEVFGIKQPRLSRARLAEAAGALTRYRVMAFVTGVVLLAGTIELIVKYAADVDPPLYGLLWIAHGWLFMVYVVITALLGFKLRWPLPRYLVVMLAGTVPTMSFVAEHFVTRQIRAAAVDQPVDVRD